MNWAFIVLILYSLASCVHSDWQGPQKVCSLVESIGGCDRYRCGVRLENGAIATEETPVIGQQVCYLVGNSKLLKWKWLGFE